MTRTGIEGGFLGSCGKWTGQSQELSLCNRQTGRPLPAASPPPQLWVRATPTRRATGFGHLAINRMKPSLFGRAVRLGLRRRGPDELFRGPFSPRRRSEQRSPGSFYSPAPRALPSDPHLFIYSKEPHTKSLKLFPLEPRAKTKPPLSNSQKTGATDS